MTLKKKNDNNNNNQDNNTVVSIIIAIIIVIIIVVMLIIVMIIIMIKNNKNNDVSNKTRHNSNKCYTLARASSWSSLILRVSWARSAACTRIIAGYEK